MIYKLIDEPNIIKNNYYIYEDGKIWSNYLNNFMKPSKDKDGYLRINLSQGKRKKISYYRIATLVALYFIGLPPNDIVDPTVNHKDYNITNNHYTNLEWLSRKDNSRNNKYDKLGKTNSFYGKTHTEESKEKIRQKNIGKKYSQETNKKKGRKRTSIIVFQNGDRIYFETAKSLSEYLGIKSSHKILNKYGYFHKLINGYIFDTTVFDNNMIEKYIAKNNNK